MTIRRQSEANGRPIGTMSRLSLVTAVVALSCAGCTTTQMVTDNPPEEPIQGAIASADDADKMSERGRAIGNLGVSCVVCGH